MKFDGTANVFLSTIGKPPFIYGTAWKKERTTALVKEALAAGFRAIDTAAQPRHYREDLVGIGLRDAIKAGTLRREEVFIQTKFTSPTGQDLNNMPYDPSSPLETQVLTSLSSSFRNLRPSDDEASEKDTYIDGVRLHSPLSTFRETLQAWEILESHVPHRIRTIGICNTPLLVLKTLYDEARVKPAAVQNRFYANTAYEAEMRAFCAEKGIVFQSFWTLTGNPRLLAGGPVKRLSEEAGVSKEVAMYSLVMELGIAPLNGTTNAARMRADLQDVERVRNWSFVYKEKWAGIVSEFKSIVDS